MGGALAKDRRPLGRKGYTTKQLGKFLQAFARTPSIVAACREVGLNRSSIYARLQEDNPQYDPDFAQMVNDLRLHRIGKLEDLGLDIAEDPDHRRQFDAIKFFLSSWVPRYRRSYDGPGANVTNNVQIQQTVQNFMAKWGGEEQAQVEGEVQDAEVVDGDSADDS